MESTRRMREGGSCDLVSRLAATEQFGMTEEELTALLKPEKYTGRCAAQVEDLVKWYRTAYGEPEVHEKELTV